MLSHLFHVPFCVHNNSESVMQYSCIHCGSVDLLDNNTVDSYCLDAGWVCCGCGHVLDGNQVEPVRQVASEESIQSKSRKKTYKNSYMCWVHLVERVSAHIREDPKVDSTDMDTILHWHEKLFQANPFYRQLILCGRAGKTEIQQLLRFVDKKEGTKYYCRKYLERWNSLVAFVFKISLPTYTDKEAAHVLGLFNKFSQLWDTWQPKDEHGQLIKEKAYFPNRDHFPNLNYAFQQIHNILDITLQSLLSDTYYTVLSGETG